MNNTNNKEIEQLISECENYKYTQSSKVSTISRNIIFSMIGTIWVIFYSNGKVIQIPSALLLIALGFSFFYLLLDLIHYYSDTSSYKKESFRLSEEIDIEIQKERHEEFMNKVSIRSFIIFRAKFWWVIITSIIFVLGIITHFSYLLPK